MMQQPTPGANGVAAGSGQLPSDQQAYHQQQSWMMVQQQQQYGVGFENPGSAGEIRSLWIGDLQPWMDENYLMSMFSLTGEAQSAKVIRNKQTGFSEGYGFIEFVNHAAAERILQTYNGVPMPCSEQSFRLKWAQLGAGERRQAEGPDHDTVDVTDYMPDQ